MKKYIVIMWGECGLANEIGFINFFEAYTVALSISPDAYIGWCELNEAACIVVPVKKKNGVTVRTAVEQLREVRDIDEAIDALLKFNPISDIRIMSEVLVDNVIVEARR